MQSYQVSPMSSFSMCTDWVAGRMDPRPLISSVVKLEDVVEKGIQELIRNKDEHVKILVDIDA